MGKGPPSTLSRELLKAARLGNIQNGLPPILKVAPAVALFAGSVMAKATGGENAIEERLLGSEAVISLGEPESIGFRATVNGTKGMRSGVGGSEGVRRMCVRCQLATGRNLDVNVAGSGEYLMRRSTAEIEWMMKGLVMDRKKGVEVLGDATPWR